MKPQFYVGDTVKYSRNWLRSVGAYTGDLPFAKGKIVELISFKGSPTVLAKIDWQNPNIPETVNVANLVHSGKVELA